MSYQSSLPGESASQSPVSAVPSIYDTYICRIPTDDVPMLIRNSPDKYTALLRTLQRSADYFAEIDNSRVVERLQLEMAKVHMEHDKWERATRLLIPLWQSMSWRREGWWHLLEEVNLALSECTKQVKDLETLVAVEWELSNSSLTLKQNRRVDFRNVIAGVPSETRSTVTLRAENHLCPISATFAFGSKQGNVGEPLPSQLTLHLQAHEWLAPVQISHIKVLFEGSLGNVFISDDPQKQASANTQGGRINLHELSLDKVLTSTSPRSSRRGSDLAAQMTGSTNLLMAPGFTKCLSFEHIPRDAGEVEVASISVCMNESNFDLEILITDDEQICSENVWVRTTSGVSQKLAPNMRSHVVSILPKPPKLKIQLPELASTYFTDEAISLVVQVCNEEEDDVDVELDVRTSGPSGTAAKMQWAHWEFSNIEGSESDDPLKEKQIIIPSRQLGTLSRSMKTQQNLLIEPSSEQSEYQLVFMARYRLTSDPETPILKSQSISLLVSQPFEASCSFAPLLSLGLWPSYFDANEVDNSAETSETGERTATGLTQRWTVSSLLTSLADVALALDSVEAQVLGVHDKATYRISAVAHDASASSMISPNDIQERKFIVEVQKLDLEDRRTTYLDLGLRVIWRRQDSNSAWTTTDLLLSEQTIPFGEPRVLAAARNSEALPGAIHLDYIIENPSMYTLTFNLSMETSEEFAFSGSKNVTVQLVPLSRHTVRYNLMPLVQGRWINPQFRVFDTHFRKTLKVNATDGLRTEEKGVGIWVDIDR